LLSPLVPHFASECLSEISKHKKIEVNNWPIVDKKYLIEENVNLVIQINGKKREILKIKKDTEQNEVLEIINKNEKMVKHMQDKKIIKKIFIPNKIINLILK
jgi:leucyl-tRNA synthetase